MADLNLTESSYLIMIAALLPLSAAMLVTQVNPYHALVIRGILGAIAALVYALLGAADVALTEALVGTMLSITLYAIAVRSSMTMRMGVLVTEHATHPSPEQEPELERLLTELRSLLKGHYMRLEVIPYDCISALKSALSNGDIHTLCISNQTSVDPSHRATPSAPYYLETRVTRLHELLQPGIPSTSANVAFLTKPMQPTTDRPMELSS